MLWYFLLLYSLFELLKAHLAFILNYHHLKVTINKGKQSTFYNQIKIEQRFEWFIKMNQLYFLNVNRLLYPFYNGGNKWKKKHFSVDWPLVVKRIWKYHKGKISGHLVYMIDATLSILISIIWNKSSNPFTFK